MVPAGATAAEVQAMRRAVVLSTRAVSTTPPNPDVGCVILDATGTVAGEGFHERPGGPHAEITALEAAGSRARGGTAVVTLEPCDHTGRTGPCAQALIQAGVSRVVYALDDPHPDAAGGAQTLRAAGIDVVSGVLADEAAHANARWLTPFRARRPFVVWKVAATLDGRTAAADGTSRWITGPQARHDVHRLRAAVDTVIVGVGTVLADDPALTARDVDLGTGGQPERVIVDTHGRTPADAAVRDGAAPTFIATAADVGAGSDGRVDPDALLRLLYRRGNRYALLEGGPTLAASFWRAKLVDRVIAYLAPALLGAGPAALADLGITTIDDAVRLDIDDVTLIGGDVRVTATPVLDSRPTWGEA